MRLIPLLIFIFIAFNAMAQPDCPLYSSVGDASSPYITTSDPDCAICEDPGVPGPWTGAGCTGTIVVTPFTPTLSLNLAFTAVNLDDYATITIDGGGIMTLSGVNVGVAGDEIGPYLCDGSFGDVFVTVTSTLPFTTVTITNTGCSSGWVIACPGAEAEAGEDDLGNYLCSGVFELGTLLSPDASPDGTWEETSGSGAFDPVTTEFDSDGLPPGFYTFIYWVEGCGGMMDTAYFEIEVVDGITAGADGSAALCATPGSEIDLNTLLDGADPGGVWAETSASGQFNPITGVFDASDLDGDDYTFTYTVNGIPPCVEDVADFTITVHPVPNVVITANPNPAVLCSGEPITLTASAGGFGETTVWTPFITNGVEFVPPLGTTNYSVALTDIFGCVGTANINVLVNPTPLVNFTADTIMGCDPLTVEFTNTTLLAGTSCLWDFGDGKSASGCGTVTHTYTSIGEFDVEMLLTTSAGCSDAELFSAIDVRKQPEADFEYVPRPPNIEESVVTFENLSLYASLHEWTFNDGSAINNEFEPVHEFPQVANATYPVRLVAANNIGCADTVVKNVFVEDVLLFYVPNTFTPDGDSFNESFKPIMTSGYDVYDYHLSVYNRWGELLFESFNAAYGWNGTYGGGDMVPDGVYVWKIEFGDTRSDKKHEYMGHVSVIR